MDIYSLVNSKDIGEHLRNINYQFNSLEAAWLVYACRKISYLEKKDYWKEIIATMPDCEVPSRDNCKGWESLHSFLDRYIEINDSELQEFYKDVPKGKYVYMYSYLYKDNVRWSEEYEHIFPSLESCMDNYKKVIADLDETFCPEGTGVVKYTLKRQSLENLDEVMEIWFLGDGRFDDIIINTTRDEADNDIIRKSFDGLWFKFPTPFKKGDIVWVPSEENKINWDCDGGFVLRGLSTWESFDFFKENGDYTDMNGYGYFVNPNGTVYSECMFNYMDLEFYHGPYKINEKILPALSQFIKGEIPVDLLLCAYRKVLLDVAADDVMLKCWYREDKLNDLGLV